MRSGLSVVRYAEVTASLIVNGIGNVIERAEKAAKRMR